MRQHNDVPRLKKHLKCGSVNTEEIGMADDDFGLVYVGWCHDCLATFKYRLRIDDVEDKAGRI